MKALICTFTGKSEIFSFEKEWTKCGCGNSAARWVDPLAGTVVVAARNREKVHLLGLNNRYLVQALTHNTPTWEYLRELHDQATEAPDHVFDKSRAACWAVIVPVGRTSDVRWATDEEYLEVFPS